MTGVELSALRRRQRWTQRELGEKLGVWRETVATWECGYYQISHAVEMAINVLLAAPSEDDCLARWLTERCAIGEGETGTRELYASFCAWQQRQNLPTVALTSFGKAMARRFIRTMRHGRIHYQNSVSTISIVIPENNVARRQCGLNQIRSRFEFSLFTAACDP